MPPSTAQVFKRFGPYSQSRSSASRMERESPRRLYSSASDVHHWGLRSQSSCARAKRAWSWGPYALTLTHSDEMACSQPSTASARDFSANASESGDEGSAMLSSTHAAGNPASHSRRSTATSHVGLR